MRLVTVCLSMFAFAPNDEPRVVVAWPSGPLEARVAFDRPLDEVILAALEDQRITFSLDKANDDSSIRIAAARLDDEARTLILLTDPHPTEATYHARLPLNGTQPISVTYDLQGVEASWESNDGTTWTGWLPELDLHQARARTKGSADHDRAFDLFRRPGTLTVRTLIELPDEETTLKIESNAPFEAEAAFLPLEPLDAPEGTHRTVGTVEPFGEPVELFATIETGTLDQFPSFRVLFRAESAEEEQVVSSAMQILPWAPPPLFAADAPATLPDRLQGGDPTQGKAVYFSDTAKCASCHQINGQGEAVGPDLSDIADRLNAGEIYREIESPSAVIHPDYLPYTVATIDGRVFAGVVRAEGADSIRIIDADAQESLIPRAEIEELRSSATSIMPVGLVGAIGEEPMRDLLAYLLQQRER